MNVYESAHSLAQAVKESDEFKEFKKYEVQIDANPQLSQMIKDFQKKSVEIQMKQMQGEQVGPETMQSVQQLYSIVLQDPLAASYMQASMRFSLMMKDVYEILGEATGLGNMFNM